MNQRRLVFRVHAVRRMFERGINPTDVAEVLRSGEIIEEYATDIPFPSRLVLGHVANDRSLHVVAADDDRGEMTYIITVYEPDPDQWTADLRRRK